MKCKFNGLFNDVIQECNAKERKDRIWVYSSVGLYSYEHQHDEGNTMQRIVYIIAYCELAFFMSFFLFHAAETGGGEYGEDGDSD